MVPHSSYSEDQCVDLLLYIEVQIEIQIQLQLQLLLNILLNVHFQPRLMEPHFTLTVVSSRGRERRRGQMGVLRRQKGGCLCFQQLSRPLPKTRQWEVVRVSARQTMLELVVQNVQTPAQRPYLLLRIKTGNRIEPFSKKKYAQRLRVSTTALREGIF